MDIEQANLHQLATEVGERKILIWEGGMVLLSIHHHVLGGGYRIHTIQLKICTGNGTTFLFIGHLVSLCSKVTWIST
jgi:hypothetical protein